MSVRRLKADAGVGAESIKNEEQRALVEELLTGLGGKVIEFLDGRYTPPLGEELTALRKHLSMPMREAASAISVSVRTWMSREQADGLSGMPPAEFAMLILFLLRRSQKWEPVGRALARPIRSRARVSPR